MVIPASTYRCQLNHQFTFQDAAPLVAYLEELGISDCYASPLAMARSGSLHGYDVTDSSRLNPELGTREDFDRWAEQLHCHNMGLILDVVPNHMCVADSSNAWWWDVLENGPCSPYARFFDIDWRPPKEELANKVLLPALGDQYGRVLENQEIRIVYREGAFHAAYEQMLLPLSPRTTAVILEPAAAALKKPLEVESKRRLAALVETSAEVRGAIGLSLQEINGRRGDPRSFDKLEKLLAEQFYRLSFWRVAADEINYRRFFDINDLAAIRVEDPVVFAAAHALVFDLVRQGVVSGLRVDHPDGLLDPEQYFQDLKHACGPDHKLYLVAEKIVVGDEMLRPTWAIDGTTGYGFLNFLNGVFVDSSKRRAFQRLYQGFTGWSQAYDDLVYESKKLILQVSMSSELNVLARKLDRISEQHRWSRDFTLESLRDALREVLACFPVYRTYIRSHQAQVDPEDRRHVLAAVRQAKRRNPAMSASVFEFLQSVLLLEDPEGLSEAQRGERRLFVMRFQQLSGPIMAKSVEDTAYYRYYPLASLNEVGGDPEQFGVSIHFFHRKNLIRQTFWPHALLATSTHDNKRSEDVRARLNALSEIPVQWQGAIRRWRQMNRNRKGTVAGLEVPSANEEYLLYQTLIGTWPLRPMHGQEHDDYVGRIQAYLEKALREAKVHSSWIQPNAEYEEAARAFVAAVLDPSPDNHFRVDFCQFQAAIARAGMWNSLSQVLLKIASPGVPDFYQGTEIWDFSLVDPDNRRPVDYTLRRCLLAKLCPQGAESTAALVERLMSDPTDGAIKLYVTSRALRFRKDHRKLFAEGRYMPLRAAGERSNHVIAFARKLGSQSVIAVAGRFFLSLGESWGDSVILLPRELSGRAFQDVLTGRTVETETRDGNPALPLAQVFSGLTVALVSEAQEPALDA